jgi:hypothetical protein
MALAGASKRVFPILMRGCESLDHFIVQGLVFGNWFFMGFFKEMQVDVHIRSQKSVPALSYCLREGVAWGFHIKGGLFQLASYCLCPLPFCVADTVRRPRTASETFGTLVCLTGELVQAGMECFLYDFLAE